MHQKGERKENYHHEQFLEESDSVAKKSETRKTVKRDFFEQVPKEKNQRDG